VLAAIFAPTNEAFDASSIVQALLDTSGKSDAQKALDKTELGLILNNHIVEGYYDLEKLQSQVCLTVKALSGRNIKITYVDNVLLWNEKITNGTVVDVIAHNGVVHTIEGVLSLDDDLSCIGTSSAGVVTFLSLPLVALSALGSIYVLLA
jgi:uncharacterized surface protein with fasciclin (FAS1) repeats